MQLKKLFLILPFFLFTINAYAGVTFYDFWINKSSPHEYVKGDRFDAQFKIKNNTNTTLSIKKVEVTFNKNGNYYKNCWYRSINKTLYKNNTYHATIGECTVNDVGNFTVVAKVQYTDNSYQDSYTYNISVVNPPIPPRPSLNSPSGNITDKTPTTKWTTVSGVTRYEFYLYDDTENEYIYGSRYNGGKSVSSTSFTSQTLKIGHTYNWWVTSCNSSGCSSQGSTYKTFKVINASQNGQCGTANGKNYSSSTTSYGSNTQCSVGNSNDTRFPTQGNTIYWTCDGLNGGNSVNCEASRQSVSLPNVSSKGINPNPVKSGESMKVYCNFYDNLPSGYKVKVGVDSSTTIYPLLGSKTTYKNFIAPSSTGTHTIYYKLYNGTSYVKNLGDSTFTVKPSSLNPPSGVSASDNTYEDKVKVTWNSVSGSSKYKIYRSQYATSNYENIDETSNTYYNDTTAVAGYTYFYTIKAYSSSLGLSSYSNYDSGKRKNVVLSPTITSVTPLIATQNVPKNYTIIGTNLTSSITGNIQGSSTHCTYVSGTSTNVVLSCKAEVLGDKRFYLKDKSGGTTISGSENIYITVNAPQSTLPSSVDTPVNGTGWSYRQHTQDNATYYDGIGSANDNNTWDLNYGSGYDDDGLPVYAVEDGVRQTFDGWGRNNFGQFLIKHTNSNGSWYSGYLHMKNITTATTIKKGDKIGEISRTGYLVNPAITSPHLHFGVYELVNNQLLSRNITISKNKNWEQPKVNKVPQHISTTLAPTNINNAQSFTITSKWKDSDGDFIVNVKARYRAKNNGSFTEVVLAHSRNTRDEVEFSRTIANGLVSGDYELEVQASDKSLLNGDVLHSTGWIKVGGFKVFTSDETNNPPILSLVSHGATSKKYKGIDFGTSKGGISLPITNTAKIKFKVEDSDNQGYDLDRIVVDFDCENKSTNTEVKTLYITHGLSGEYTVSHDYNKSNFTSSDDSNFWKKNLKWCANAYDKRENKSETLTSGLFTIYDKRDWTTYKQEKDRARKQKEIDDKKDEYSNANTEYVNNHKIYEDTCSETYSNKYNDVDIWKLIEDDNRRIVNGEEIYKDDNGENTFYGTGKINNKHPYKIIVTFGKEHNYPAKVEIEYDIVGYPLYNGKQRYKSAIAYNYDNKEYLKSAFIHQIIADNIGKGTCLNISTDPHNAQMFSSSSSVEDLALQIKNNNQKDHGLYPAGYYEIAKDIANGTEPKIAKEIIFDTFSTLDVDTSVFLMLRENKLTQLYFEFLNEEDYLNQYDKDVRWAFYHYTKWNEKDNYNFPNKLKYFTILKMEFEKDLAKKIIDIGIDLFIDRITLGSLQEAHGYAGAMINQGKKLIDIAKNIKNSKSRTTRVLNNTMMGAKIKYVSDRARLGIDMHKKWKNDNLYGNGYLAERSFIRPGEFTYKGNQRYFRFDAIKFDRKNNKIIISELKPNNTNAINKGNKQLIEYKTLMETLKKTSYYKEKYGRWIEYAEVITNKVITYEYK